MTTERAVCNSSKKDVVESFLVYWENEGSVTAVLSGCIDKPVVGERKIVKQGKNEYTGKLIYEGTKEEMCRLEQLFIEDKFDPLDHQLNPLDELLALPLNKETKRQKKRKLVSKPAQAPAKEPAQVPAQDPANDPVQKPKRKKTGHTILKVTAHGGICPVSVASSGCDQTVTTLVQSSSGSNETVTTSDTVITSSVQPSQEHAISNNKTSMPTLYPASSDTTAQFSDDDDDVVVISKLPVPPFTMAANTSLTVTPGDVTTLTDGEMSSTRSSTSMDISYENETDVRLENVEVRLSHLEYRVRCIEGTATHDDKWSTPAMASGYTPAEASDYTPATTTTGYTPPWDYNSQRYTNSLGHASAPLAQGYTP